MGLLKSADEKQAKRERKAAEEYAQTPLGLAEAARERGDAFFQLEIENGEVAFRGAGGLLGYPSSHVEYGGGRPDLLGEIEKAGWRLEHVGYVFFQTSSTARRLGRVAANQGKIIGIYLFRAV